MFDKLWKPINIGKVEVKNRIALAPMVGHPIGVNGEANDPMIRYYEERAKGGVGLIITGTTIISPESKLVPRNPSIESDIYIYSWASFVDAIHFHGSKVSLQIGYGGAQGPPPPSLNELVSASAIPRPGRAIPRPLTVEEIGKIIEDFAAAAARAKMAGFDMVEIHGANGYLIQQFLSPLSNKRTDIYGADRALFYIKILRRVKQRVGDDFPVVCGFTSDECMPGGMTVEDGKALAKRLEANGAAAIRMTRGTYETIDHIFPNNYMAERGLSQHFLDAKAIRKVVSIPVISGAGIIEPTLAEQALAEGYGDIVQLGRQLIADPEWAKKVKEGRIKEIRKCILCNDGCIGRLFELKTPWCTVNPFHGWEYRYGSEVPAAKAKKRVVVVGGGPAGMNSALIAAQRGHEVILLEKNKELGGTVNIASIPEFKKGLNNIIDYFKVMLPKAGVKVKLGTEATVSGIMALKPDAVVVATGSKPLIPDIIGVQKTVVGDDVLTGKAQVGKTVVVVGGGAVGCDVGLFLGQQGKNVTIVELLDEILRDMNPIDKLTVLRLFGEAKIKVKTGLVVEQIQKNQVVLRDKMGRKTTLPADTAVLAVGRVRSQELYQQLKDKLSEVYAIGDCDCAGKIMHAMHAAVGVAMFI